MTTVFITCGKAECNPKLIEDTVGKRKYTFSEGQSNVWTCMHVKTFRKTYESKYEVMK